MKIIDVKNAELNPNPHNVKTSLIYNTHHAMVVHLILEPGEHLKKHITPVDVFFYVLEGNPEIEIEKERKVVKPDHLVESPAGIPHCIYNPGNKRARVMVVKTPRPSKPTKIL
ncbi:MAG: cupin domain-containing protein [Vulcanimicrobiota bacterium]